MILSDDSDSDTGGESPARKIPNLGLEKTSNISCVDDYMKIDSSKPYVSDSKFGEQYLAKHGYQKGKGLGKREDGIVNPVEASKQKGRRGFGFKSDSLNDVLLKYDPNLEVISIDEEVIWLENDFENTLKEDLLESWVKTGPPIECIEKNSFFCDSDIIQGILDAKNVLTPVTSKELKSGRRRSNPFESISRAIFLNRAAMKMANMDAILGWMFTEPKTPEGEKVLGPNDLLYFADVCAGPGGFSEYVLYRKKWLAKGFGFTLRAQNDFLLNEFIAGPPETFEPYYGIKGDGNVYYPENITSFRDHVLKYTDGKGVHFMMADGGVKIEEQKNDQELISKKLYLCQCIVSLYVVRIGGHFVVKLFDLFTPFSIGLIYLMYRSFRAVSIIKPNTSRPANSERYLVCKWKRPDCLDIATHLFSINKRVPERDGKRREDVLELVPINILREDKKFYQYIVSSNNRIGKNQIISLHKLAAFSENADLKEEKQQELRKQCLRKWNIPDEARAEPPKCDASSKCRELLGTSSLSDVESDGKSHIMNCMEEFKKTEESIYNWRWVVLNGEEKFNNCAFYLGLGRNKVFEFKDRKWKKFSNNLGVTGLCLPANTLVYGELVQECIGEGNCQRKTFAFHIIDGLFLGEKNIRHLPLMERWKACSLFSKALDKESFAVRVKELVPLERIDSLRERLELRYMKSARSQTVCIPLEDNTFWKAGGVMFLRDTHNSWNRFFSRTNSLYYLYNIKRSLFEKEVNDESDKRKIYADFDHTHKTRMIWWWGPGVPVHPDQTEGRDLQKLQIENFIDLVKEKKAGYLKLSQESTSRN